MLTKFGEKLINWINSTNPFTNVYGVARSLIALSTLITLLFNSSSIFFRPFAGSTDFPLCSNKSYSLFCLVPNEYFYLEIVKWLCIFLLILVISGWRPRITGILHWWVSFSLFNSAIGLDGGEQVATVFTLFLIPITLADPRKNHWKKLKFTDDEYMNNRMIALVTWYIIRIQVAVLYGHSVIAKIAEEEWINGTAVWYYLQSPMLGVPNIIEGPVMGLLSTPFIVLPTWGSLIMQVILVTALFAPKKYWATILTFAVLMHEIFAVFLGLISFSLAMLGILILYLRPLDESIKLRWLRLSRVKNTIKYWYQKRVIKEGGKTGEILSRKTRIDAEKLFSPKDY